jgi:hypothetical protein
MILSRHSYFKFPIKLEADKTIQSFVLTLTIEANGLEMRKLQPSKVKRGANHKLKKTNKPPNTRKVGSRTFKKFFVRCSIAIRVKR